MTTFKEQGTKAFQARDFESAVNFYTQALEENPSDHTILGNRSAAKYQLKNYDDALADAEQCISLQPEWSKGYQRKAMALQAQNNLDEAIAQYTIGVEKDANNAQCKQLLEKAQQQKASADMPGMGGMGGMGGMPGMGGMGGMPGMGGMGGMPGMGGMGGMPGMGGMGGMPGMGGMGGGMGGGDGPFSPAKLAAIKTNPKFAAYFQDVKFKNMFDMCCMNPQMMMQFMMQDPRMMEIFKELTGIDLMEIGKQSQKADEEEKEAAAAREATQKQAKEAEEAKRAAAAEAAMPSEERANIQKKRDAEAKKLEGNAFYKKKDFANAIKLYSEAIELNPKEMTFYSNLAAVYFEMSEFDNAIEQCDKVIALSKEGNYDYVKLGKAMARKANCLFRKDMLEESIALYREALLEHNDFNIKDAMKKVIKEKDKKDALAYINPEIAEEHKEKGNELFKNGDFPGAIKEFDEGLRRDPDNKFLYGNRSFAYIKLMEPVRGLADAEKALQIDPEFVKAWARKGICHQLQKEYHKAMEAFEKGLNIDPNSKECKEGAQKTMMLIQTQSHASSGNDEERFRHAMADPEIQNIMRDPSVTQVLRDMQENPASGQAAMRDPTIAAKIQKLIAAGVLKVA